MITEQNCVSTFAILLTSILSFGYVEGCAARRTSLKDLPQRAIKRSQTTLPSSLPFHLKAKTFEATNADNHNYDAEIEELWAAPDKWRRTIKTAKFSETSVMDGGSVSEQVNGDYYPLWLRILVNAIFDPGAPLQGVDLTKSSDNPMPAGPPICRRFGYRVGIPPVANTVFASYCFQDGLLQSIGKPGYNADYSNYEKFGSKQVAHKIQEWIEPGTTLEADIVELNRLSASDDSVFRVEHPSESLRTVAVSEETLRALSVNSPPMRWPTIQDGKPTGTLSIYVCVDRRGRVRESYGLNSDNPYMTDAARKQIKNWVFQPFLDHGEPVQVEAILTFAYQTQIAP